MWLPLKPAASWLGISLFVLESNSYSMKKEVFERQENFEQQTTEYGRGKDLEHVVITSEDRGGREAGMTLSAHPNAPVKSDFCSQ